MKFSISKEEGNRLEFELSDVNTSFANAVRRYSINSVPVFAIDEVTFYENSSSVFDEFIAHRIGLVPILTPSGTPKNSEVNFYLDAKGPKVVYSSELESKDKDVKPAKGKIPIVTLGENQELRLEGKAVLGTSHKHAKFQPGLSAYEISDGKYKFVLESFYQMEPRDLLSRAVSALEDDIEEAEKLLEKAGKKKK